MLDGFFINGPLLHYSYEFLEKHMPAGDSIRASVFQAIITHIYIYIHVVHTAVVVVVWKNTYKYNETYLVQASCIRPEYFIESGLRSTIRNTFSLECLPNFIISGSS